MQIQTLLHRMLTSLLPAWIHPPGGLGKGAEEYKRPMTHFPLDKETTTQLAARLQSQLARGQQGAPSTAVYISSAADEHLIRQIRHLTGVHNRDNLTRTSAYFDFYQRNPAVHWALLAHLVSRNGGWSMTDLQGDPMGRLVRGGDREHLFQFLERCNFLIFGDAFPQLLIWEASVRLCSPLFDLLPRFGVSRAMIPIWEHFWAKERQQPIPEHQAAQRRSLLTHALIANEQNFIEQRVIQQKNYEQAVLNTAQFRAQQWLDLSLVLFPHRQAGTAGCELAGVVVHDFGSLDARIANGKQLYEILFGHPQIFRAAANWASKTEHSGSRSDYLPSLFEPRRLQEKPDIFFAAAGCQLQSGSQLLASPYLRDAWPEIKHASAEPGDWCKRPEDLLHLLQTSPSVLQDISFAGQNYDVLYHYCTGMRTMLTAAKAWTLLTES